MSRPSGDYIFISYSHKDTQVLPVLDAMREQGYRIWYDKMIPAGKDWLDTLLDRIAHCKYFMPFLSASYEASKHCLRELRYADDKNREIVPVYLEVQIPDKVEYFLREYQRIAWNPGDTPEAFAGRLSTESFFQSCRESVAILRTAMDVITTGSYIAPSPLSAGHGKKVEEIKAAFRNGAKEADALRALQGMSLLASNVPIVKRPTIKRWLGLSNLNGLNRAIKLGWLDEQTNPDGTHTVSIRPVIADVVRNVSCPDADFVDAVAGQLSEDMIVGTTGIFTEKLSVTEHAVALDKIAQSISLRTANYGKMLRQMGLLLYYQADYDRSLFYQKRAVEIEEQVLGTGHHSTAITYNNIALVYKAKGDYDSALEWYGKALRIREKVLGTEHPSMMITYNNIAGIYYAKGYYDSALEWYGKALRIREKVLGTEHPSMAITYNNIAGIYYAKGYYDSALEWYGKALRIREKVLGMEHPDTATSYYNIGLVYYEKGDYDSALEWHGKALRIREKVLGMEHPDTATSYHNIGIVYFARSNYSEALKLFAHVLAVRLKVLGAEHLDTKNTQEWMNAARRKLFGTP